MFLSNGLTSNQRQSSPLMINDISSFANHDNNNSVFGRDDELINLDLESFSLSPKSRSETRQARRTAEPSIELSNELITENPLSNIFGQSANDSIKLDSRRRRGSIFEDDQTEEFIRASSSSSSSRIFSVKAAVNRPREVQSEELETISFIPDIDELDDPIGKGSTDIPNNFVVNKLISLQELESDMIKHQAFSNLCGTDSTILSARLISQAAVKEEDAPWTWESLISEVASYIERNEDE